MALTDEQEAALRAELVSLSGELATIARVNGLIQRAHARHEAEERQKDDELAALRAALEHYRDPANWGQVRVNGTVWTVWRDGEPTQYAAQALAAAQSAARTEEGEE